MWKSSDFALARKGISSSAEAVTRTNLSNTATRKWLSRRSRTSCWQSSDRLMWALASWLFGAIALRSRTLNLSWPLGISNVTKKKEFIGFQTAFFFPSTLLVGRVPVVNRSEEHTSELQSPCNLVCRLLLEKKKK